MGDNAFYSNKRYARMEMTILLDAMVMFETVERSVNGGIFGEWQLGIKFNDAVVFPTDQSDLNEIRDLAS